MFPVQHGGNLGVFFGRARARIRAKRIGARIGGQDRGPQRLYTCGSLSPSFRANARGPGRRQEARRGRRQAGRIKCVWMIGKYKALKYLVQLDAVQSGASEEQTSSIRRATGAAGSVLARRSGGTSATSKRRVFEHLN